MLARASVLFVGRGGPTRAQRALERPGAARASSCDSRSRIVSLRSRVQPPCVQVRCVRRLGAPSAVLSARHGTLCSRIASLRCRSETPVCSCAHNQARWRLSAAEGPADGPFSNQVRCRCHKINRPHQSSPARALARRAGTTRLTRCPSLLASSQKVDPENTISCALAH